MFTGGVDFFTTTGAVDGPYAFENFKLESTNFESGVPTMVWRVSNLRAPGCTAKLNLVLSGLPAFTAALRPSRGLAPRSVRIKDLFPNGPGATDLYRCSPGAAGTAAPDG